MAAKPKTKVKPAPVPVEVDVRISFGIKWFATEAEAMEQHEIERKFGSTFNGGWYHGMPCGRDDSWDKTVNGVKLYACTF